LKQRTDDHEFFAQQHIHGYEFRQRQEDRTPNYGDLMITLTKKLSRFICNAEVVLVQAIFSARPLQALLNYMKHTHFSGWKGTKGKKLLTKQFNHSRRATSYIYSE
jgi:hypothetical protein